MTRLRVALVGCGDISAVHLDAILAAAADGGVEAVGVCDVIRARRGAAAARAGCPGFTDRLAIAAEDSRAVFGVCSQNRYNDTARRLRELLDRGELGRVLGARASVTWFRDAAYYGRRDWRGRWATAGGGVLMNQAIHTLDLLQSSARASPSGSTRPRAWRRSG